MAVTYQRFTMALEEFRKLSADVERTCQETTDQLTSSGSDLGAAAGSLFGTAGTVVGSVLGSIGGLYVASKVNRETRSRAVATITQGLKQWEQTGLPIVRSYLSTCEGLKESYELERDYYVRQLKRIRKDSPTNIRNSANLLASCIASDYQRQYSVKMGRKLISYFKECYSEVENIRGFAEWQQNYLDVDKPALYRYSYNKYVDYVQKKCPDRAELFSSILTCYSANHAVYLGRENQTAGESCIITEARKDADAEIRGKYPERQLPDYIYQGTSYRNIKNSILRNWNKEVVSDEKASAFMYFLIYPIPVLIVFLIVNIFVKLWRYAPRNSVFLFTTWYGNALSALIVVELIMLIPFIVKYRRNRKAASALVMHSVINDYPQFNSETFDTEISTNTSRLQENIRKSLTAGQEQDALSEDELASLAAMG